MKLRAARWRSCVALPYMAGIPVRTKDAAPGFFVDEPERKGGGEATTTTNIGKIKTNRRIC